MSTAMRLKNLPQMKERYMEIVVFCDATFIAFYGGKENTDKYVRALILSVSFFMKILFES